MLAVLRVSIDPFGSQHLFLYRMTCRSMPSTCPPLNDNVVKSMKGNRRKDTKPELMLRKALREAGFPGYRLQWKVPGCPDICYPGRKVAIFVNGCYWHRCPMCNLGIPKHNAGFWTEKFERNVARDALKTAELEGMGWRVITVWECRVKKELGAVVDEIALSLTSP